MITAVDTNVLLDLLTPGAPYAAESQRRLEAALDEGSLLVCEAVFAELGARFLDADELETFLSDLGAEMVPSEVVALHTAGQEWQKYSRRRPRTPTCSRCATRIDAHCSNCGSPLQVRQHILSDFLIGAHAVRNADRLLTRDRGYYQTYFPQLVLA